MKFDPEKKELFTDEGEIVIKELFCPHDNSLKEEDFLANENNPRSKICSKCEHPVLDTSKYTEEELVKIIKEEPKTCISINSDQDNIQIINTENEEEKTESISLEDNSTRQSRQIIKEWFAAFLSKEKSEEVEIIDKNIVQTVEKKVFSKNNKNKLPEIKVISGLEEIDQAVQNGLQLLVHIPNRYYDSLLFTLVQNDLYTEVVKKHSLYDPEQKIEAYLIPDNLQMGDQVFIEKLIEERSYAHKQLKWLNLRSGRA
ncbi:MAG TPA: hypothetical protein DCM02_12695 [Flavobacterium sp.]|nr:hypothetical protein [Flavobacterium sp.]